MSELSKRKGDVVIKKRNKKIKYRKKIKGTVVKDFKEGITSICAWIAKREHQKFYDVLVNTSYIMLFFIAIYFWYYSFSVLKNLHMEYALNHVKYQTKLTTPVVILSIYSLLIWVIGTMGDFSKKPFRRLWYLGFSVFYIITFMTTFYIDTTCQVLVNYLGKFNSINIIPINMLYGTIREIVIYFTVLMMAPPVYLFLTTIFDKELREVYKEFEIWRLKPDLEKDTPFVAKNLLCVDWDTGVDIYVLEKKAKEHKIIVSGSGGGKTSQAAKPAIANRLEYKYILREEKKKVAIECLQKGWAFLTEPVDNDYFSKNFDTDMVQPYPEHREEFINAFKKKDLILGVQDNGKIVYRDVGLLVVSPDGGLAKDVLTLCDNFNIEAKYIDPDPIKRDKSRKIYGINPMLNEDHNKVANVISSVLYEMMYSGNAKANPYFPMMSQRAIQNTVLLLLKTYPEMHDGKIPSLYDILELFVNPDDVEPYMDYIKDNLDPEEYKIMTDYFFTSFLSPEVIDGKVNYNSSRGSNKRKVQEAIEGVRAQLSNLLTMPSVRHILCSTDPETTIDLKESLAKGDVIVITTRIGYLSKVLARAFANFILLTVKDSIFSRYSEEENPEILFDILLDEFPFYINEGTEELFTFSRKYQCAMTVIIQDLAQLDAKASPEFRKTLITNTDTKVIFNKLNDEDARYWEKELGYIEVWKEERQVRETPTLSEDPRRMYNISYKKEKVPRISSDELRNLPFGAIAYKVTDRKGITKVGKGLVDFVEDYYKKQQHDYTVYDFNNFYDKVAAAKYKKEKAIIEEERSKLIRELNKTNKIGPSRPVDENGLINDITDISGPTQNELKEDVIQVINKDVVQKVNINSKLDEKTDIKEGATDLLDISIDIPKYNNAEDNKDINHSVKTTDIDIKNDKEDSILNIIDIGIDLEVSNQENVKEDLIVEHQNNSKKEIEKNVKEDNLEDNELIDDINYEIKPINVDEHNVTSDRNKDAGKNNNKVEQENEGVEYAKNNVSDIDVNVQIPEYYLKMLMEEESDEQALNELDNAIKTKHESDMIEISTTIEKESNLH